MFDEGGTIASIVVPVVAIMFDVMTYIFFLPIDFILNCFGLARVEPTLVDLINVAGVGNAYEFVVLVYEKWESIKHTG